MKRAWLAALLIASTAHAHSASDAYLTLTVGEAAAGGVIHGQWDIALRDLDFVLQLDDDGAGRLTWGEVRRHLADVERYAFAHLRVEAGTRGACTIKPTSRMIDGHADGTYAALFFDVLCPRAAAATLDYDMFFAIDPSHRGIVVIHGGNDVATAVLSPQHRRIDLPR